MIRKRQRLVIPSADVTQTEPVPPILLRRLWAALAGVAVFMIAATVQGVVRPGYDPWHQAVSALSLGPGGWIQTVNFNLLGAVILSTVPIWHRVLAGGRGASAYPRLTLLLGVSLMAAGCVPQDPAPGYDPETLALQAPTVVGQFHLAIAAVAALCTVLSLLAMASRFAGDRQWRGWTFYSRLMAGLVVFCVAVYGVWSTKAAGYAGTFERAALVIPARVDVHVSSPAADGHTVHDCCSGGRIKGEVETEYSVRTTAGLTGV